MNLNWWQILAYYYYRAIDCFESTIVSFIDYCAPMIYLHVPNSSIQANNIKISGSTDAQDYVSE